MNSIKDKVIATRKQSQRYSTYLLTFQSQLIYVYLYQIELISNQTIV